MLDHFPIGLFLFDAEDHICYVNHRMEEMTGYPAADLLGQKLSEILNLICPAFPAKNIQPEKFQHEFDVVHTRCGKTFPAEIFIFPLIPDQRTQDTQSTRAVLLLKDSKDPDELFVVRQQTRFLLEALPVGMYTVDKNYILTYVNEALCSIFHLPHDQILGKDLLSIAELYGTSLADLVTFEALKSGQRQTDQRVFCTFPDGTIKHLQVDSSPFVDTQGRVLGSLTLVRDITDQVIAEERLRLHSKMELIGQLGAGLAHEIRNPLTSIRGFCQILKSRIGSDENSELLELVINEVDRANEIITDFLTLSKGVPLKKQPVSIHQLIHKVVNLCYPHLLAGSFELKIQEEDKELFVLGEAKQLTQLFLNLITNALEAMEEKGTLSISSRSMSDQQAEIIVSDTGPGIPDDVRDKIFNPFYTTKETGTGLGLAICSKIVKDHAGEILVRSSSRGAQIILHLPKVQTLPKQA